MGPAQSSESAGSPGKGRSSGARSAPLVAGRGAVLAAAALHRAAGDGGDRVRVRVDQAALAHGLERAAAGVREVPAGDDDLLHLYLPGLGCMPCLHR